jgi:toxin ParE1/3/4
MPAQVIFSREARAHLQELEDYLAERFYPGSAEQYIQRLIRACGSLSSAPYRGTRRDDLQPGIRTTGFEGRVTIYFAVEEEQVWILALLYGGREFQIDTKPPVR